MRRLFPGRRERGKNSDHQDPRQDRCLRLERLEGVYSVFQQGAGRVDAYEATHTSAGDTANRGLDIDADLPGVE